VADAGADGVPPFSRMISTAAALVIRY